MFIGVRFGKRFHIKVEALGGIILVVLGIKILIEHTCA
jgi:putative Mn2+ efflux pump MntP